MSLLIVLPRERAILSKRRAMDVDENEPIMHALDSDVFNYLCSKTDWASGQVGVRSKVSYSRIALALTEDIPRKPTRSLRQVKRKCVYNSVQRLIKAGLLISESITEEDKNALILSRVFWLDLLTLQASSTNADSQQLAGCLREVFGDKACHSTVFKSSNDDKNPTRCHADGTYKSNNLSNAKSDLFCLPLTWRYDEKLVELFLQAAGFSAKQIKTVWFGKYVQYWSRRDVQRTQREWSEHFANHMQSYLLRPDFFEKMNGMLNYLDDDTSSVKTRSPRSRGKSSKKLTVPMIKEGAQLQAWAVKHGLPDAPVGASTTEYYQWLCNVVERAN